MLDHHPQPRLEAILQVRRIAGCCLRLDQLLGERHHFRVGFDLGLSPAIIGFTSIGSILRFWSFWRNCGVGSSQCPVRRLTSAARSFGSCMSGVSPYMIVLDS
jgi:hypothetical protein